MNPIDQIRKALEAGETLGFYIRDTKLEPAVRVLHWISGGCRPAVDTECALWDALHAAVQRAAELGLALEEQRSIAIDASECADVQRIKAAEMQERCAQVCDARAASAKNVQSELKANRSVWDGAILAAQACAAAIRAIKE